MKPLSWLIRKWFTFWFEPMPATNLAVSRILIFGCLALFYLPQDMSGWADVSPAYWQPIWVFKRFNIPVLGPFTLDVLEKVWKVSLALACAGLFTRTSMWVAAILGAYLLGLPHNFGQTYHFDALLVIVFGILACSRAGDALSIDARRRAAANPGVQPPAPSGEYKWPIQLSLVGLSLVFFAAGVAKIRHSGIEWFMSDHMAILLDRVQYRISDADPLVAWGSAVAAIPWVPNLMAFFTIAVETAYPLALFSRRLRVPLVLAGIGLIVGIRMLMGPTFEQFLVVNAFWVPWDRVFARMRSTASGRALVDRPGAAAHHAGAGPASGLV
jgi:hypothetical protein